MRTLIRRRSQASPQVSMTRRGFGQGSISSPEPRPRDHRSPEEQARHRPPRHAIATIQITRPRTTIAQRVVLAVMRRPPRSQAAPVPVVPVNGGRRAHGRSAADSSVVPGRQVGGGPDAALGARRHPQAAITSRSCARCGITRATGASERLLPLSAGPPSRSTARSSARTCIRASSVELCARAATPSSLPASSVSCTSTKAVRPPRSFRAWCGCRCISVESGDVDRAIRLARRQLARRRVCARRASSRS